MYTYTLSEKRVTSTIYMFDTQAPQSTQVMLPIERDRNNMPKDLVQGCRKRILLTSWVALCGRRSIKEPSLP